jgi:hypothetical protein
MLRAQWLRSKTLAVGWFVLMSFLFLLPGAAFKGQGWFNTYKLDKLVHVGLFAVFVFLWYNAFYPYLTRRLYSIIILSIVYGLLIELMQGLWIRNRSFDLFDVGADVAGSIAGFVLWSRVYND